MATDKKQEDPEDMSDALVEILAAALKSGMDRRLAAVALAPSWAAMVGRDCPHLSAYIATMVALAMAQGFATQPDVPGDVAAERTLAVLKGINAAQALIDLSPVPNTPEGLVEKAEETLKLVRLVLSDPTTVMTLADGQLSVGHLTNETVH